MLLLELPKPPVADKPEDPQHPPRYQTEPDKDYASRIREFLDKRSPYDHPLRIRRQALWRKADLFDQSIQWIQRSYNIDPTRTPHWSQIEYDEDDPDAIPTPVYNEISGAFQNESARLSRPEYKPYVRPAGESPDAKCKEAAKTATEILTDALERMDWDTNVAELGFRHMPMYGGWVLKSWWDISMDQTIRVRIAGAMRCPACDFRTVKSDLTEAEAGAIDAKFPDRLHVEMQQDELGSSHPKHSITHCMTCQEHEEEQDTPAMDEAGQPLLGPNGEFVRVPTKVMMPGPPKLEPFTPVDQELHETDSFGRDLGKDVQLGEWKCKTCSPYDVFWENLGLDLGPNEWREILEVHVESLDWVRSHFPDKADAVKPENQQALLQYHPVGGEREIYYGTAVGDGAFKNHTRVKEYHKKPYMEWTPQSGAWKMNLGRSIMMAGDVVLLDAPYLMESKVNPGAYVARVHYDYVPWELRSGGREKDGASMAELLFDVQENINEAKSQTQDTRQRMASPKWLTSRQMNLDYAETGNAGTHWVYDPPADGSADRPREVGSTTISAGVQAEIEDDRKYFARASNTQEVETGNFPPGVTAASAIQIAAEQAGERRRPRIRRIRKAFQRTWKHGLELMHEFVLEPRVYKSKDESNEWRERTWKGADILGQTDVRIDPEPDHDTSVSRRENVITAINHGVLKPAENKRAAMLVAKKLDVPQDLYEDDDLQYEAAEREFWDFMDQGRAPVVDADLDDHPSHNDQHGSDCLSEPWRRMERISNWDEALLDISGWDQMDPTTGMRLWQKLELNFGQAWPPALELRILEAWKWLLNQRQYVTRKPRTREELTALAKVMRFRAHRAAHKVHTEQQAAQAATGMPVAAAPEAMSTPAGTMPATQAPVA